MQGTTGRDLQDLTDSILLDIGIANPLHRVQLLNQISGIRDEILSDQVFTTFHESLTILT